MPVTWVFVHSLVNRHGTKCTRYDYFQTSVISTIILLRKKYFHTIYSGNVLLKRLNQGIRWEKEQNLPCDLCIVYFRRHCAILKVSAKHCKFVWRSNGTECHIVFVFVVQSEWLPVLCLGGINLLFCNDNVVETFDNFVKRVYHKRMLLM